jgi:hypothetical protein
MAQLTNEQQIRVDELKVIIPIMQINNYETIY